MTIITMTMMMMCGYHILNTFSETWHERCETESQNCAFCVGRCVNLKTMPSIVLRHMPARLSTIVFAGLLHLLEAIRQNCLSLFRSRVLTVLEWVKREV